MCPPDTVPFGARCYLLSVDELTYVDAQSSCETDGGTLVITDTDEIYDFIATIMHRSVYVHVLKGDNR